MGEPMLATITAFGGSYSPRGWAFCDGSLKSVSEFSAVYSVVGTAYGGDGRTTFGLPDLRGRSGLGLGSGPGLTPRYLGTTGGYENVSLTTAQMPSHTHDMSGGSLQGDVTATLKAYNGAGGTDNPSGGALATPTGGTNVYARGGEATQNMSNSSIEVTNTLSLSGSIEPTGGSQMHTNMAPWTCLNYLIAMEGYYPSRS